MKKITLTGLFSCLIIFVFVSAAPAHFQMIIPSDDIVETRDSRAIDIKIMFIHPFEGHYMNMAQPVQFGVLSGGSKQDLLSSLKPVTKKGHKSFTAVHKLKRPGDKIYYIEPEPYWESAEDCFIIHYTKVIVNAFGLEEGWDEEIGLKTEIVPLTRPYGLYAGNIFQGIVKVGGKPVPFSEVEVEYYNESGRLKAPAAPFITQVIKADAGGIFTYAMPRAGWWGFAALNEDSKKKKGPDGKEKDIEIGAVIWVKTIDMK